MKKINNRFEQLVPYLEGLINQSRDAFWIRGSDYTNQLFVSPAYEKIWGRSCESLYAEPDAWIKTIFEADREQLKQDIEQRSQGISLRKKFLQTFRIVRPDGKIRWIEDECFAIFDDDGKHIGFAGTGTDITEQKEHEINLQKEKEREEAISKAKSEFIANMSHDIKTPLSGMIGMATILISQLKDQDKIKHAQNILSASQELMKFIENCLEMVRLEDGQAVFNKENFNLNILVDEVFALYQPSAKTKGLSFTVEHEKKTSDFFSGNRGGIYRILLNLVGNAIKFTSKGSVHLKVSVSTKSPYTRQPIVKFTITDTGIGIHKSKQNVIFQRYTRVSSGEKHYEGSGIGLHVVKKIVERLQGEIYLVSEEGKGSSFFVVLPLDVPLLPPEEYLEVSQSLIASHEKIQSPLNYLSLTPADLEEVVSSKKPRVLLVEDNAIAQQIAQFILAELGCEVDVANSGEKGIELYTTSTYDLAFVDVGLPDMSGYLFVKEIRKLEQTLSRTPLAMVMLTASAVKDLSETPASAGVQEMMSKPLTKEKASEIINTYISVTSREY